MKIIPIRTHKISGRENILSVIDRYAKKLKEGSILAITSKIVAICEGRTVRKNGIDKKKLVRKEADYFLPALADRFHVTLTIKDNILCSASGIDESNGNGRLVLWPKNPQSVANRIRRYLTKKYRLKNLGVIITDSKSNLMRRGASGIAIAYSGFQPINDYVGKKDLFGRTIRIEKANVVDPLAIAAVMVMGEGAEQTPMALISEVNNIKFSKNNPSRQELEELNVSMDDDYFKSILKSVKWKKGGK
jgi:putative folate metabolism gamma-glutamate ligase